MILKGEEYEREKRPTYKAVSYKAPGILGAFLVFCGNDKRGLPTLPLLIRKKIHTHPLFWYDFLYR